MHAESVRGQRVPACRRPVVRRAGTACGRPGQVVVVARDGAHRALQELGTFDAKTSSRLRTPADVRAKGGAIFGDWRYGRVFVYHNGAQSYYAARGFRASLKV